MQDIFADAMNQLLSERCPPAQIRQIEATGDGAALWAELIASGFADALVPEALGGAGLSLAETFSIVFACGYHALPLPFAHTVLVRGLSELPVQTLPEGPITLAGNANRSADGAIHCTQVPFGRVSGWVLVELNTLGLDTECLLLPTATATSTAAGGHGSLDADLHWAAQPDAALTLAGGVDWRAVGAALSAALLAGAQERILN